MNRKSLSFLEKPAFHALLEGRKIMKKLNVEILINEYKMKILLDPVNHLLPFE